jgi:small multidrug resistance family-3 protein
MYITVALLWLWAVDGVSLSRWDLIGASFVLLGMAIIAMQP